MTQDSDSPQPTSVDASRSTLCSQCGADGYRVREVFRGISVCETCKSKLKYPRWPRGRWNGRRIIGFSVKVRVSTDWWGFVPHWPKYAGCSWLWFILWLEPEFE